MLINKKLLVTEGQRRGTRYLLSKVFEQSEYFNINSISNEMDSINKSENSISNEMSFISNNDDTNEKLTNIAKLIVTKKRVDVNLMENVILKLCIIKPKV